MKKFRILLIALVLSSIVLRLFDNGYGLGLFSNRDFFTLFWLILATDVLAGWITDTLLSVTPGKANTKRRVRPVRQLMIALRAIIFVNSIFILTAPLLWLVGNHDLTELITRRDILDATLILITSLGAYEREKKSTAAV